MTWTRWSVLWSAGLFFCVATGCGDDDPGMGPDASTDTMPDVVTDALVDATPTPPMITSISITENPNNPLSATIEVETDVATSIGVEVSSGPRTPWTIPTGTAMAMTHTINVLGMRAESMYGFEVTVTDAEMETAQDDSLTYESPALPADFPPIVATIPDPSAVSGVTLFNTFRWNPSVDGAFGLAIAVDNEGEVIWYYRAHHQVNDLQRTSSGTLVYNFGKDGIAEIDMMGNMIREVSTMMAGTDSFHHEITEMPNGNFLSLSSELRNVMGFEGGTVSHDVVGDVLIELDPSWSIVNEWTTFDLLDPLRIRPGFDAPFWNEHYMSQVASTKDWTHGNAIIYDARDDSMIVCLRHQDWLVKVSRATGMLMWRFGEEGDFTLAAGGDFPFHAHAPEIQPNGNILVYDNGNARSTLMMGEAPFSRAVEYELDEMANTATQVWEYRGSEAYFAPFLGDADALSNGNVLITDGGQVVDPAMPLGAPSNQKFARIVEVTRDAVPVEVFRLDIRDATAMDPVGWSVYRAERFDSLYPTP